MDFWVKNQQFCRENSNDTFLMIFKHCVTVAKHIIYRLFMLKLARHYILPKHLVGREIVIINYVDDYV